MDSALWMSRGIMSICLPQFTDQLAVRGRLRSWTDWNCKHRLRIWSVEDTAVSRSFDFDQVEVFAWHFVSNLIYDILRTIFFFLDVYLFWEITLLWGREDFCSHHIEMWILFQCWWSFKYRLSILAHWDYDDRVILKNRAFLVRVSSITNKYTPKSIFKAILVKPCQWITVIYITLYINYQ